MHTSSHNSQSNWLIGVNGIPVTGEEKGMRSDTRWELSVSDLTSGILLLTQTTSGTVSASLFKPSTEPSQLRFTNKNVKPEKDDQSL